MGETAADMAEPCHVSVCRGTKVKAVNLGAEGTISCTHLHSATAFRL